MVVLGPGVLPIVVVVIVVVVVVDSRKRGEGASVGEG